MTTAHTARRVLGSTAGAILTVLGSLVAVSALALIALFGSAGAMTMPAVRIATPTAALVADIAHARDTAGVARILGAPAVHVAAAADTGPVFVGIARTADVDRYLAGVATDEVSAIAERPVQLGQVRHPGGAPSTPPGRQTFWVATATSPSVADLTWRIQDGDYRLVVMNVDGTPGMTTQVRAGVEVPNLFVLSVAALVTGLLATAGGIALIVATRRRRPVTV